MRTCRTTTAPSSAGSARAQRAHRPAAGGSSSAVPVPEELDLGSAQALLERVHGLLADGADVELDAGGVVFVDCCGLAALERCLDLGDRHVRLARSSAALDRLVALVAAPTSPLRTARGRRSAALA